MALLPMVFGLIFQSTLPYGSDIRYRAANSCKRISIHAPLRERFSSPDNIKATKTFQSTLPYGSDDVTAFTINQFRISIHAPLRER